MAQKQKLSTKLEHLRKHLDAIAAVTVAVGTLGGSLVAAGNWIISEVSAQSNQRIDQLQQELDESNKNHAISTLRLELMFMMEHNPQNIVEIELLAKKYFVDYGANFYMTELYSEFARKYGADTSFVVSHN